MHLSLILKQAAVKSLRERVAAAEARTRLPRSQAEIEAGNYDKGKFFAHGLLFTVETAKGQTRSGTNKVTGKKWSVTMKNSYGYINRTSSAEPGDQMDFFLGPCPESEVVFVIDQNKFGTKEFDEHKCVIGCWSSQEARKLYMDNYSSDWDGYRACTPMTMPQFRAWLKHGDMKKPAADQHITEFVKKANVGDWVAPSGTRELIGSLTDLTNTAKKHVPKMETVPANLAQIADGMRLVKGLAHPTIGGLAGVGLGYGLGSFLEDHDEQDPAVREVQRKRKVMLTLLAGLAGTGAGVYGKELASNPVTKALSTNPVTKAAATLGVKVHGKVEDIEKLKEEARERHYQDTHLGKAMLYPAALAAAAGGLVLPGVKSLVEQKPFTLGVKDLATAGAFAGIGAAGGLGAELFGRLFTRTMGPTYKPNRWMRDQDPERINLNLRLAALVTMLVGTNVGKQIALHKINQNVQNDLQKKLQADLLSKTTPALPQVAQ